MPLVYKSFARTNCLAPFRERWSDCRQQQGHLGAIRGLQRLMRRSAGSAHGVLAPSTGAAPLSPRAPSPAQPVVWHRAFPGSLRPRPCLWLLWECPLDATGPLGCLPGLSAGPCQWHTQARGRSSANGAHEQCRASRRGVPRAVRGVAPQGASPRGARPLPPFGRLGIKRVRSSDEEEVARDQSRDNFMNSKRYLSRLEPAPRPHSPPSAAALVHNGTAFKAQPRPGKGDAVLGLGGALW